MLSVLAHGTTRKSVLNHAWDDEATDLDSAEQGQKKILMVHSTGRLERSRNAFYIRLAEVERSEPIPLVHLERALRLRTLTLELGAQPRSDIIPIT